MPITWPDVVVIAPELATLPGPTQLAILDAVAILTNCDTFEEKCDIAQKYLAAHLGTIHAAAARGRILPVTASKVGDVSRGYALPVNWRKTTETTSYGLMYEFILARALNAHLPLVC